jgi:HSP20 family protein
MAVNLSKQNKSNLPAVRQGDLFAQFQREMDRLISDFARPFGLSSDRPFESSPLAQAGTALSEFTPRVNVTENDKEIVVSAELPGMEEKDVEVLVEDDVLIIRGQKTRESEADEKNIYRYERTYGSFQRQFELPAEVQEDRAEASFKNGLLTVRLPKVAETKQQAKKIPVRAEGATIGSAQAERASTHSQQLQKTHETPATPASGQQQQTSPATPMH